jgi:hypothetical protein
MHRARPAPLVATLNRRLELQLSQYRLHRDPLSD